MPGLKSFFFLLLTISPIAQGLAVTVLDSLSKLLPTARLKLFPSYCIFPLHVLFDYNPCGAKAVTVLALAPSPLHKFFLGKLAGLTSPRTWSIIAWICSAPLKSEASNWGSERPKSSPASMCRRVSVPIPRPQAAVCSEYKISHGGRADLAPQFPNSVPGPLCYYLEDTVRLMKRMQAGFRVHASNQISPCLPLEVFKHPMMSLSCA
jgi:hypothetical protein